MPHSIRRPAPGPIQRPRRPLFLLVVSAIGIGSCDSGPTDPEPGGPSVEIARPSADTTLQALDLTLEGSATGPHGLVRLWPVVNGEPGDTVRYPEPVRSVQFSVHASELREGENLVEIRVVDARGNTGADTVAVRVSIPDTLSPRLELHSPVGRDTIPHDSFDIQLRVRDDRGVERLAYRLNAGPEQDVAIPADTAISLSLAVTGLALGINVVRVAAYDAAGHADSARVEVLRGPGPYTVTRIGGAGGDSSVAHALNDRGEVVGRARRADGSWYPFLWSDGRIQDLSAATAAGATATDITELGTVLVSSRDRVWTWKAGAATEIRIDGVPTAGVTAIRALHLNERGDVVGYAEGFMGSRCYWGQTFLARARTTEWLPKPNDCMAYVAGLTEEGVTVGTMDEGTSGSAGRDRLQRAFLWNGGTPTFLTEPGVNSAARDVSAGGAILWRPAWTPNHLITQDGVTREVFLPTRWGAFLNDAGGTVTAEGWIPSEPHFLRLTKLLADASWEIVSASDINNRGQILAQARKVGTGAVVGVVLTPPPGQP